MTKASGKKTTRTFNPTSTHPARAVQAWQILVGKAMNRQTVTYEGLSLLMYGKKAQGVLNKILGHIAHYCSGRALPTLPVIVVGKTRGTAGEGIPLDQRLLDEEREKVYEKDWYDIVPPSENDFTEEYANAKNRDGESAQAPRLPKCLR